jgi:predicted dehydrogenase
MVGFMNRRHFIPLVASSLAFPYVTIGKAKPDPIKIGQIGMGHPHASGKLSAIRNNADFEFVGLAEPDAALRKKGGSTITVEHLLNTPGLQAVAIETAVKNSQPYALLAAQAGVHLHLDKPGSLDLPGFKAVYAAAEKHQRTIQMGYMLRYNPAFELCFKAVQEGWLGELFELSAVMSKTIGQSTRDDIAQFSGGFMFELACHVIDAAVYVLGKPENVTPYMRRTRPETDSLADNCLAVLEYPEATATIRTAAMEVDGFKRRQFVVCGDRGTVDIRPMEPPKMLLALAEPHGGYKKGYQEVSLPRNGGRYDAEFADLARVIRGEKAFAWSYEHDLAVFETVLRASGMTLE